MSIYVSELDFKSVDELATATFNILIDPEVDAAVREWGADQLAQYEAEIRQVRRGDDGFLDFLTTFIKREADRAKLARDGVPVQETPYQSLRQTPVCTCNDLGCALKAGTVPQRVRRADDRERGLTEFTLDHAGNPIVLDHDDPPGARQAWAEQLAEVRTTMYEVFSACDPHLDGELPPAARPDDYDAAADD